MLKHSTIGKLTAGLIASRTLVCPPPLRRELTGTLKKNPRTAAPSPSATANRRCLSPIWTKAATHRLFNDLCAAIVEEVKKN